MRFLALYTYAILRGSYCSKGHNSIFILLSRAVTTNTKYLCLCCPPSLQLADISSADILFVGIPSVDIPFADILFANILFTS